MNNPEKADKIAQSRYNTDYLPQLKLADAIEITSDLEKAVSNAEILLLVVPSHGMADLCCQLSQITDCTDKILVSCTKGFEYHSGMRMSELIKSYFSMCNPCRSFRS